MKIGIITINDNRNLGNRLQNFAVQKILSEIDSDFNIETIKNSNRIGRKETCLRRIKNFLRDARYFGRTKNFALFNKNIKKTKNCYDASKDNNKLAESYDYFLVGSDQVWNPYMGWLNSIDLLSFAKPEQRIAFSASFGVNDVPEERKDEVAKQLSQFKAISVREDRGREIVEELTGRKDAQVLVDPTMLLSKEEWSKIAKKTKELNGDERFILKYFLGEISQVKQKAIDKIAEQLNCTIIDIFDKKSKYYSCGPSEFLWLEAHAKLICTDSFHSSVFAIINEKPFVVFDREGKHEKMNSRLETLISKFELQNRWFNGESITAKNLTIDYAEVKKILKKEQEKSLSFLKKALEIKDEN